MQIANAIDLHCHYGPDTIGGTLGAASGHGVTALEASREAAATGLAALVLKSHSFASPALAATLSEAIPGLRVFGGICTDFPSGGLNVEAVEVEALWAEGVAERDLETMVSANPARLLGIEV